MQSLAQNADYIVCLALETTSTSSNLRRLFATPNDKLSELSKGAKSESAPAIADLSAHLAQNAAVVPRVVHLEWCVCSVKDFKVLESASSIVNPGVALDAATVAATRVTQEAVTSQGVSLQQALDKLQTSLTNVVGSGKYRVCSFGDWVVHYALALDCQRSGAKLPESLKSNFVNILDLHYDQNPAGPHAASIEELLKANELEPSPTAATELKAKTDGASLVRIFNRMIRSHQSGTGMAATDASTEESKTEVKRDRSRSRSRDNQESTDAANAGPKSIGDVSFEGDQQVALKMRGLPWKVTEEEIQEFFAKFAYVRESIKIGELEDGRKTGHATVLFETEEEAENAMTEMDRQHIGTRWVQLHQMSFSEYEKFMDDQLGCITVNLRRFLNEENLPRAVKLRGLPREVSKQEVMDFFADYNLADDDVVIEIRQGRKTGFALAFLNNEDDVQKARDELNKQYIGDRYVDVMIPEIEE